MSWFSSCPRWLCCSGKPQDSDEPRVFQCNEGPSNKAQYKFIGNEIHTTKYTLLTFLPKVRGGRANILCGARPSST